MQSIRQGRSRLGSAVVVFPEGDVAATAREVDLRDAGFAIEPFAGDTWDIVGNAAAAEG